MTGRPPKLPHLQYTNQEKTYLPDALQQRFAVFAESRGLNKAALLRTALIEYMNRHEKDDKSLAA